jgi:Na+/melibiose symporter-like transporter
LGIALGSTSYAVLLTLAACFFKFVVHDKALLGPAMAVTTILGAICMPLWVALSNRFGKK